MQGEGVAFVLEKEGLFLADRPSILTRGVSANKGLTLELGMGVEGRRVEFTNPSLPTTEATSPSLNARDTHGIFTTKEADLYALSNGIKPRRQRLKCRL